MKFRATRHRNTQSATNRRGIVLVIVTAVLVVLALSAYTTVHWLTLDAEIVAVERDRAQARLLAESGVALVEALAIQQQTGGPPTDLYDNAALFAAVAVPPVAGDTVEGPVEPAGRFSVISFDTSDGADRARRDGPLVRFGVRAEGGKIDLNHWFLRDPAALAETLLLLPGATEDLVDAVLDWLDSDDQRRPHGAESDDYSNRPPTVRCRNGPIDSLDELLAVRGMTPEILFGEDANRNGWLDANEDDGPERPPIDDADGLLQPGWADVLTVHSRRRNLDSRLRPRIDLNDADLGRLYGTLRAEFDEELARFVIAYRVIGPTAYRPPDPSLLARAAAPDDARPGRFYFRSVVDLVDATVRGKWEDQPVTLDSPIRAAELAGSELLTKLMDRCTTRPDAEFYGQLDLSSAPAEALVVLKGLNDQQRRSILAERPDRRLANTGKPTASPGARRFLGDSSTVITGNRSRPDLRGEEDELPPVSLAWLLTKQILTPDELIALEPSIAADSSIVRFQVVGWVGEKSPAVRIEAVIDTAAAPPRVLSLTALDRWGPGIDVALLSRQ